MALAADTTRAQRAGEWERVSRPTWTTMGGILPSGRGWSPLARRESESIMASASLELGALARETACFSQSASSIPPWESASFIPLSGSGLWDAVIMAPTSSPPSDADLSAANIPILTKTHGRRLASYRNPAVPYEYLGTDLGRGWASIIDAMSRSGRGTDVPQCITGPVGDPMARDFLLRLLRVLERPSGVCGARDLGGKRPFSGVSS
mmetsp:Transcript_22567/g.51819  ORF Transcript_22567/g.51819 Transcript_22567/m.51819 type:complete len:208 (+) Transcript_22567:1397-2020(+)